MKRVALDFDGVLADTHTATIQLYNEQNDTEHSIEDITEWEFGGLNMNIDEYLHYSHECWVLWSHGYISVPAWQHRIDEFVGILADEYWVDIVTGRQPRDEVYVYNWLEDHAITPHYRNLIFVQDGGKEKYEYDYDIYIDDNPNLFHNVPVQYMPLRPWNEHEYGRPPDNSLVRADSLLDIARDLI